MLPRDATGTPDVGVVEDCSRVFIPRENGVLQMDRICYCGKPGGHKPPHVCLDCGGRWGEGETRVCESGCGCRYGTDDPDRLDCACDGPCCMADDGEWDAEHAGQELLCQPEHASERDRKAVLAFAEWLEQAGPPRRSGPASGS